MGDRIQLRNALSYTVRSNGAEDAVVVFSNNDDVTLTGVTLSGGSLSSSWFVLG